MVAQAPPRTPHEVLGLETGAAKEEVQRTFRALCMQLHPDKCAPELRATAEVQFRELKSAYEAILKGQAGYSPPPPGAPPSRAAAGAYWTAHSPDGRVPWGKYGGFATELEFYRHMMRNSRHSFVLLALVGLVAIPTVSGAVTGLLSEDNKSGWWGRFKEEGVDVFSEQYSVNGQQVHRSPYQVRGPMDSYVFKHGDKYRHLQDKPWMNRRTVGAVDEPAPAASATGIS